MVWQKEEDEEVADDEEVDWKTIPHSWKSLKATVERFFQIKTDAQVHTSLVKLNPIKEADFLWYKAISTEAD